MYYAPTPALQAANGFLSPASWTARSFTGVLNDWDLTPGVGLPDFSATAAPLHFGYFVNISFVCAVTDGCIAVSVGDSIDNFSVKVTSEQSQVPEPSSFVLGGTLLAAVAAIRRRRR